MNFRNFWNSPIAAAASLTLLCGCEQTPLPPPVSLMSTSTVKTVAVPPAPSEALRKTPPETLSRNLSPDVAEVVKLVQSGLEETVVLAFIQNSPYAYQPAPDELVYLSDLGVSGPVMAAMIQRGQHVREQQARAAAPAPAAAVAQAQPAQPEPQAPPAPAPVELQPAPVQPQVLAEPAQTVVVVQPPSLPAQVNVFYTSLSPYGSWFELPGYGWCWQPSVVATDVHWRPYGNRGRWLHTDCGWYWQSDYSWGWAPFHYGRWHQHDRRGWVWTPDTTWGPAWVSWRYSDSYCGWAPLPPTAHYSHGHGFSYLNARVGADCDFGLSHRQFSFVSRFRFLERDPHHYFLPSTQIKTVYNQTVVINNYISGNNNTVINQGIAADRVTVGSRSELRKVAVRSLAPGSRTEIQPDRLQSDGGALVIYRPTLTDGKALPTPANVPHTRQELRKDASITGIRQALPVAETPAPPTPISRRTEGGISRSPYAPVTGQNPSAPQTIAPPQPISSVPQSPAAPRPITSVPQRVAPPTGFTTTPQRMAITSPTPITSTPQVPAAPRPVTSTPQPLAAPQPVRTIESPYAPVHSIQPQRREIPQTVAPPAQSRRFEAPTPSPSVSRPAPAPMISTPAPTPAPQRITVAPAYTPPAPAPAPAPQRISVAPSAPAPSSPQPASRPDSGRREVPGKPGQDGRK